MKAIYNILKTGLVLSVLLAMFQKGTAQYVTLPDTNFVNYLDTTGFAQCISGGQLDTTCAAVLSTTALACNNPHIKNIAGVQYFKNLIALNCMGDSIQALPQLPPSLQYLDCSNNVLLTNISGLPDNLASLICRSCNLASITRLPAALTGLDCTENSLTALPSLPAGLKGLQCASNQLAGLPALPDSITEIDCELNGISRLPALPASLLRIFCYGNALDSLPVLPPKLQVLWCGYNGISALPLLPSTLISLVCDHANLYSLPDLPDSLYQLGCDYNPNLKCLPEIKTIYSLSFQGIGATCLPDYGNVYQSSPALSSLPLCNIFNVNSCTPYWNVSGKVYYDGNENCKIDSSDYPINYCKVTLDSAGQVIQQQFTGSEGYYSFKTGYGNYIISADTSQIPFSYNCPDSGYIAVTVSNTDSLLYDNNFAFKPRHNGFDLGVRSMVYTGPNTRPATIITLHTIAGDMAQLYSAVSAAGISGQLTINFEGPCKYLGPAAGALPPSVVDNGRVIWNIADFGTVNDFSAFNLLFAIDSDATPHSHLVFTASIQPETGDNYLGNNNLTYQVEIIVPHDPNLKEVSPQGAISQYQKWLTYTIRFQNTGTATAINVQLTDTLDESLDASTIQLMAYSAKNITLVSGNIVTVSFSNINLPDSIGNDSASRGYVQFMVKIKDGMPLGTVINNDASIVFDFNQPVVTNTVSDTIVQIADNIIESGTVTSDIYLFPNPAQLQTTVAVSDNLVGAELQLFDGLGRIVLQQQINTVKTKLHTALLNKGIYLLKVNGGNNVAVVKKLVIQ